jgi:hypothetical protein
VGKPKGKAKTAIGQVKIIPKRAPFRKVCTTCRTSWMGDLLFSCGHDTIVEQDI